MVRKILQTTDPKLREKSKPILKADKKLLSLIRDLEETLKAQNDPEGLGLAAPQVGVLSRVFILQNTKGIVQVFINPEVLQLSEQTNDIKKQPTQLMEGCLSLPHYYGPVQRAESVTLKYLKIAAEGEPRSPRCEAGLWRENLKLKTSRRKFSGFLAHIIQHEVDHLNGILFVDRLLQQNRTLFQLKGKEWNKVELI